MFIDGQPFYGGFQPGKDIERELLGTTKKKEMESCENKNKFESSKHEGYASFERSIADIKHRQRSENFSEPEAQFADDLYATIVSLLNLEDNSLLSYYTALAPEGMPDTALDWYHGVDAFFELQKEKGMVRVTIDASMRDKDIKADIFFKIPPDFAYKTFPGDKLSEIEDKIYNNTLRALALEIIDKMNKKSYN